MNYFKEAKTSDDIKRIYRELAKKIHPDHGGTKEEMIELTRQYDEMIKYGPPNNPFERKSTFTEAEKDEYFKKGQAQYHKHYGGYGGYRYSTQGSMWNEYKQQSNDPRLADYERIKTENQRLRNDYLPLQNENFRLYVENEKLKKKISRLEKKLKKPTKVKKDGKNSPSICL